MDPRLKDIIETLLLNIDTLNNEIVRMGRTDQFSPTSQCFQLIEHIRGSCMCSLQNLRTVERRLYMRKTSQENAAKPATILALHENLQIDHYRRFANGELRLPVEEEKPTQS